VGLNDVTEPTADPGALAWFAALPVASRTELLRNSVVHTVAPETVLFEQGEMPTFQHVVLTGSVHLLGRSIAGREVLIEVVEAGDLITPAAVVTGSHYLLRARVAEPSKLLLIHAPVFRLKASQDPALAHEVIGSLAGQFRRLVRQIKNLKLRTVSERAGCYLIALSRRQGTPHQAILPYEKHLIASELGMTRESFSRALAALQEEGVTVQGTTIAIRNPDHLAAACGLDPLIDDPQVALSQRDAATAIPPETAGARRARK
jgi:CRP/FNR family transcriptional regulator, transcriptional activator FtrB